jgi:hypothetical protein
MVVRYVKKQATEDSGVAFKDIEVGEAFRDEDRDVAIKTGPTEALVVGGDDYEIPVIYDFEPGESVEIVTLEIREVPE